MELEIFENTKIAENIFSLKTDNPALFDVLPGQFFMVKINDFNYPLLRRPFSIADFTDRYIEIIYKVVGEGTKMLTKKKRGDFIDLLGPLGSGFDNIQKSKNIFLVGGGIGVAPLIFLAKTLNDAYGINYEAYFGFNTKDEIYVDFGEIATMDKSFGYGGNVVDMVESKLDKNSLVFACGPTVMLKNLAFVCEKKRCEMQVSLESRMACGIGVCLGCVVEATDNSFKRVCVEGPIFDYRNIKWQAL